MKCLADIAGLSQQPELNDISLVEILKPSLRIPKGYGAPTMILVVASKKDTASMNIRQQLILHYDFGDSSQKYHGNKIYCKEIQGQADNFREILSIG